MGGEVRDLAWRVRSFREGVGSLRGMHVSSVRGSNSLFRRLASIRRFKPLRNCLKYYKRVVGMADCYALNTVGTQWYVTASW